MALKEDFLQFKLCEFLRAQKIFHFHVPNGGNRSQREANKFKAIGVKAGIPDLIILNDGNAIFIELKVGKTKEATSRKKFMTSLLPWDFKVIFFRLILLKMVLSSFVKFFK